MGRVMHGAITEDGYTCKVFWRWPADIGDWNIPKSTITSDSHNFIFI
jgi:hypothetical protein